MTRWFGLQIDAEEGAQEHVLAYFQGLEVSGIEEIDSSRMVVYRALPWEPEFIEKALNTLLAKAGFAKPKISFIEVEEEDWLAEWKSHWEPLPLGNKMWIVPAWWKNLDPPAGRFSIRIDPGMAFGTGTHETTALAWELLEDILTTGEKQSTYLELGLGTGLLSLGAAVLNKDLLIVGTEGDPRAIPSLAANLAINPSTQLTCVLCRNVPVRSAWAKLGVVNMTFAEHEAVREELQEAMAPEASLVLSGLFPQQAEALSKWWSERGFDQVDQRFQGEWTAVRLDRTHNN